jgi:hypothetical protein
MMTVCCADAQCRCDKCQRYAALLLDHPLLPRALGRSVLCEQHLCELATDAPVMLHLLMSKLIELLRAERETARAA